MTINVYTDGACNGEQSGGWAIHSPDLNLTIGGKETNTTNNRMELTAILKVLEFLKESQLMGIHEVIIHSDSAWSIGAITQNWDLKANLDLVSKIKDLIEVLPMDIHFNKVKGHSGLEGNVVVDQVAVIMSNLKTQI